MEGTILSSVSQVKLFMHNHPDITFAVDWALKANYLSIYLSTYLYAHLQTLQQLFLVDWPCN